MVTRRTVLAVAPALALGFSGCTTSSSTAKQNADVIAGPGSRLTFGPEQLTISAGETVLWYFDSRGHNVCGVPAHHPVVSLPDGATPFRSYPDDNTHRTVPRGETFSHTFDTPGTYTYVCIPHAPEMKGRIEVE